VTLSGGVDLLFLLILVTFCIRGGLRGLSGEAISLVTTIGGFIVAWKMSPQVSKMVIVFIPLNPAAAQTVSIVAVYVTVLVLGVIAGRIVKAFLKFTNLSGVDRGMGIVAGAVKTYALLMIIYAGVMYFSPVISPYWMNDSYSMTVAHRSWPMVQKSLSGVRLLEPGALPWGSSSSENPVNGKDGNSTN
jgi:membrane protein required for colicin V production